MRALKFARLMTPLLLGSALQNAQATRTWVSGVGDDANPCSRTAPCKTFAGAISKTAAGGEINALDPGGYGVQRLVGNVVDHTGSYTPVGGCHPPNDGESGPVAPVRGCPHTRGESR